AVPLGLPAVFFFQAEDGIRDGHVTGVQTCALPISMNFLLVESLQKFHHYFGDEFKVEFPTGSGQMFTLAEVAGEISRRLNKIFRSEERRVGKECRARRGRTQVRTKRKRSGWVGGRG